MISTSFFFFGFIWCSLRKSMDYNTEREESSMQNLHLLNTLIIVTETAPTTSQTPIRGPQSIWKYQPRPFFQHSHWWHCNIQALLPLNCCFFDLFTNFAFLPTTCRHLSTFALGFSLLSLYTLFFNNFNEKFWQRGLERKMEWELEPFHRNYFKTVYDEEGWTNMELKEESLNKE